MLKKLIEQKCNVNEKDASGTCAIIEAAKRNDTDMVKMLLDAGAKPLVQNRMGCSTLSWAEHHKNTQMLSMLKSYNRKRESLSDRSPKRSRLK